MKPGKHLTVSYPQVQVLPYLTVAVKEYRFTLQLGRFRMVATWRQKPVIPEAFREDNPRPESALRYKIRP